ncbi:hypothetical protein FOXYSP1_20568 [Fusarium oxysporum f. sp. phaseoli]
MSDDAVFSRVNLSIDVHARVLICCHDVCRVALSPSPAQVSQHLRTKHNIPAAERRLVTDLLKAHTSPLQNPSEAPVRQDGSSPDPNLHLVHGFTCKFCIERTGSSQVMSRHITSAHEKQRLQLGVRRNAMYEPVFLQAWTKSPSGGRYWIVEYGGSMTRPVGGKEVYDHLEDIFERERGRQKGFSGGDLANGAGTTRSSQTTTFTDLRPWLERTGWERTFGGIDRELLKNLTTAPSPVTSHRGLILKESSNRSSDVYSDEWMISSADDERKITALLAAVDMLMDRCEQTARTTSRSLLCWLRSVRPHGCYAKPFTFVGKAASRRKYIRVLKRFVALVFRAYRLPADIRQRRAGIRFKKSQLRLISTLWNHEAWTQHDALTEQLWRSMKLSDGADVEVDCDVESTDGEDDCEDGDDSDDQSSVMGADDSETDDMDDEDEESEEEDHNRNEDQSGKTNAMRNSGGGKFPPWIKEVLEFLFGLIMAFCTEEVMDGRPDSTLLVYYSGVLGFSADLTGFLPARSYTSNLAALIYIQRLLFLEYAVPTQDYPRLGISRRPRTDQLARLQNVRQEYLVLGSQSPFEELFSLLVFGRAIAGSETPAFLLKWSDDGQILSYRDDIAVHMEQFRRLPKVLLARAEALCEQLMYGWKPPCDLSSVKDDMANTTHEFSFVSHPKNGLAEAYFELTLKACTSQADSLSRKGRWNQKAIFDYLKKEEALRENLAGLMLMTCGGQPRSPDLLSVRVRNHRTSERGLYIYNGYMIYVTRSHKAKRSTNREFVVARFFPSQVGHLMYTYLVYIRPFVDMLAREQLPNIDGCSSFFFRSQLESDSPHWCTERLTKIVRGFTRQVWDQGITLRLLRQICIGIADKHVREVSRPFNRFDDRTDNADRGVVFAWSSGHRPLQRARTYGLDGAFPTHLQPQLLERYEWVSVRWHEFLHLPSRYASRLVHAGPDPIAPWLGTPSATSLDDDSHNCLFMSSPPSSPQAPSYGAKSFTRNDRGQNLLKCRFIITSPQTPAKRRRVQFAGSSSPILDPPNRSWGGFMSPVFGKRNESESITTADEQERIISYLNGKQTEIRLLNEKEAEIVIPTETGNEIFTADPCLDLIDRLNWIHQTTEAWRFVGCELCFIIKGGPEPNHGLDSCEQWPASKHAKRILQWLTTLKIPRYYDVRGACSMCGHGWLVCDEMGQGELARREARSQRSNSGKANLMKEYDAAPDPDGYCMNKPVVRRIIAALCAYDDQILGKALTKMALDHEGIDLTSESQARLWLEQRIRSQDDYWVSRLIYVLDQLIMAYDFRRSRKQSLARKSQSIDLER